MNTAYRSRVSPYQLKAKHPIQFLREKAYDTQDKAHPVREEIQRCLGSHTLTAIVEEDMQTLTALKGVEGVIAFLCTLTKNGQVISQGRGSAVLNQNHRFIGRTVGCAFNAAISDAAIRCTKVLDTFRDKTEAEIEESLRGSDTEPATTKQLEYLQQLIQSKVTDEDERRRWEAQLGELTKNAASSAIQSLKQ